MTNDDNFHQDDTITSEIENLRKQLAVLQEQKRQQQEQQQKQKTQQQQLNDSSSSILANNDTVRTRNGVGVNGGSNSNNKRNIVGRTAKTSAEDDYYDNNNYDEDYVYEEDPGDEYGHGNRGRSGGFTGGTSNHSRRRQRSVSRSRKKYGSGGGGGGIISSGGSVRSNRTSRSNRTGKSIGQRRHDGFGYDYDNSDDDYSYDTDDLRADEAGSVAGVFGDSDDDDDKNHNKSSNNNDDTDDDKSKFSDTGIPKRLLGTSTYLTLNKLHDEEELRRIAKHGEEIFNREHPVEEPLHYGHTRRDGQDRSVDGNKSRFGIKTTVGTIGDDRTWGGDNDTATEEKSGSRTYDDENLDDIGVKSPDIDYMRPSSSNCHHPFHNSTSHPPVTGTTLLERVDSDRLSSLSSSHRDGGSSYNVSQRSLSIHNDDRYGGGGGGGTSGGGGWGGDRTIGGTSRKSTGVHTAISYEIKSRK